MGADRRRFLRRPKLLRFILVWRKTEEKVFTTDVSLCGMFLRSTIAPPPGAEFNVILPEARPTDECLQLTCKVVRHVRRGDPYNPLGGVGVEITELLSPRGTGPALELLTLLLGKMAPQLPVQTGAVRIQLPSCTVAGVEEPAEELYEEDFGTATRERTRTVAVEFAVFCRWRNMIIQASLKRLGQDQAIISNLKVVPEVGDEVTVRLLGISESRFRGLQFIGRVDQLMTLDGANTLVSLALDPMEHQPELGVLRQFLRSINGDTELGGG